jgi:hypothetical protein
MDHVIVHKETGFLICKQCKYALIPSRINSHFQGKPHLLKPDIRRQIEIYISQINGLVLDQVEIQPRVQGFLRTFDNTLSIPKLALYSDGFACSHCPFIIRSLRPIQNHYREEHSWTNPRKSGQKKKKSEKESWEINVRCQRFFEFDPGNQYFRVNSIRAGPSRTSGPSRTRISRRENSSESSEDEDEDSDLPEGIYLFSIYLLTFFITIS